MKKKIFAAAVAFVATMSLATSAFAAAPGGTNGTASAEVKVEEGKATTIETSTGLTLDAPAGAFEAGADIKLESDVIYVSSAPTSTNMVESAIASIASASGDAAKATLNTSIKITLSSNGNAVQPNGKVKVTVAWDGKSNVVAYVNKDKGVVEFFALTVNGNFCSFETDHFSDYFMASVDKSVVEKIAGKSADVNNGGSNNNPGTGIALAVAPAGLAVAFVGVTAIVSKKKRG